MVDDNMAGRDQMDEQQSRWEEQKQRLGLENEQLAEDAKLMQAQIAALMSENASMRQQLDVLMARLEEANL